MNRKDFIRNTSLAALAAPFSSAAIEDISRPGVLKVAFVSDVHIKPTAVAEEGMRKAFKKVNSIKPNFIMNGGDTIMDAMKADKEKVQAQWDVWHKVIRDENKIPMYHAIGNHDAWGWQMNDPSIKNDPLYDKAWVIKELKMPGRYYSFSKQNWKFIVLDTAHENNGGYIAKLDEEQFNWLQTELKNTSSQQHICIVSHIPVVSFCAAMFTDKNEPNGDWKISRALLLTDARKVVELFSGYKNIRCCLSGHIHLQDEVEYKGIQYFCNGAISGNWWNGAFKGFSPAFALFQFKKNGSVSREIINY